MVNGVGAMKDVCADKFSQLDVVANNLANVSTPGFKVEHLYQSYKSSPDDSAAGEKTSYMFVDYSPGILQKTDNALDVAINGEGFFVIETQAGITYTRKGNFTVNKNKQLVTQSGDYVLGEAGPIKINGRNVNIDNSGTIRVDGMEAGKLKIVSFDNRQKLVKHGDGLFMNNGDASMKKVEKPYVSAGHLELSNVNAIQEMVEMISIERSFEAYHKTMKMMEDMDKLSTSRIGRLA